MTFIGDEAALAWVLEHTDVERGQAEAVLAIEFEYMWAVGMVFADPSTSAFLAEAEMPRYYQPGELNGAPRLVDTLRVAQDAERLAGVPESVGLEVLDAEFAYLVHRGLA